MGLKTLLDEGFDLSSHIPFTKKYNVRCSQCQAMVFDGIPTHENGCPNAKHECAGCNDLIPMNHKYCTDCR